LCNLFGTEIENGEMPNDIELVGSIIKDICFNNAKNYFGWEVGHLAKSEKTKATNGVEA
jgi:glucuronate isomerase